MAKIPSTLSTESIRQVNTLCATFGDQKIKSVYALDFIKSFRAKFAVKENLQVILFGQMIPEDGFRNDNQQAAKGHRIKSFRT